MFLLGTEFLAYRLICYVGLFVISWTMVIPQQNSVFVTYYFMRDNEVLDNVFELKGPGFRDGYCVDKRTTHTSL
jgi:hypothetical protein